MDKKTWNKINQQVTFEILCEFFGVSSKKDLGDKISHVEMDKLKETNPGIWYEIKCYLGSIKKHGILS